jgi:benzil reductase ((S)-benzoin forming)
MEKIFTTIDFSQAEGIYLVNNAGVVDPIKPVGNASTLEISKNIQVNLLAPMILSTYFIKHTCTIPTEKIIVNVSSGAANRAMYGWSAYCSSKAGLDMFTKTVAVEQAGEESPVKMISFSPGVMDTDMQATIRQTNKQDFADVEQFIDYCEKGLLRSPEVVSEKLLHLLFNESIENGQVYNINNML